jgi:hypothetical protein
MTACSQHVGELESHFPVFGIQAREGAKVFLGSTQIFEPEIQVRTHAEKFRVLGSIFKEGVHDLKRLAVTRF